MDKLYLKILEVFKQKEVLFTKYDLPAIKYIDLYRGQPLAPQNFELYDVPALFLEYAINWDTKILNLSVHVVTDQTHSTSSISTNKMTGLQIFTMYNVVKEILKGVSSEHTGKLKLISERPAETDVVNYQIIDFSCSIEDVSMEEKYQEGIVGTIKTSKKVSYIID